MSLTGLTCINRFHAFDQAISFYRRFDHGHQVGKRWARAKYEEEALAFTSAVNEAEFLFDPKDGVVDTMRGLLDQADLINNGRETDLATLEVHVKAITSKMAPYLNFHAISADGGSEPSCYVHPMTKKHSHSSNQGGTDRQITPSKESLFNISDTGPDHPTSPR